MVAAQSPYRPYHCTGGRNGNQQRELVTAHILQQKLDGLAENVAEASHHACPQQSADQIEHDELCVRDARHADQHRTGDAQSIHETHADHEPCAVALDQFFHPCGMALHAGKPSHHLLSAVAAKHEEELIAEKAASSRQPNDPRQLEQRAMRSEAGHDQHRLTFEEGAEKYHEVAVAFEEGLEVRVLHGRTTLKA